MTALVRTTVRHTGHGLGRERTCRVVNAREHRRSKLPLPPLWVVLVDVGYSVVVVVAEVCFCDAPVGPVA